MVYAAGRTDHTIDGNDMLEHIVTLVERKAAALEAEKAAAKAAIPVAAE
jgi:(E)-4-hydroxy-3-methylbut-2-enyl-diphosphate synthase